MKKFFDKYSFGMVKMFVNQCVIGLFGNVLALCTAFIDSTPLTIGISIFSMLFYFFLIYMVAWEFGSKDMPAIEANRMKYVPLTGLFMALGANIPNFLLATIHAACLPFAQTNELLSGICGISRVIALFIDGMYTGIMSVIMIGENAMNTQWWAYYVIIIPSLIVSAVAYVLGSKDIHFTKLLLPLTPEEMEIKREKKMKKK